MLEMLNDALPQCPNGTACREWLTQEVRTRTTTAYFMSRRLRASRFPVSHIHDLTSIRLRSAVVKTIL